MVLSGFHEEIKSIPTPSVCACVHAYMHVCVCVPIALGAVSVNPLNLTVLIHHSSQFNIYFPSPGQQLICTQSTDIQYI